ncbi:MAG: hypothetical protein NT039_04030, partial [Candidatus Berkelbacteria bacterium]|nr:hypothetical protein [Candidatus Berkelbacteria bacterium]
MVQDREKLREVGLEPDKPTGHIRAIWALTLILAFALVIAGGIYFILWYSPWNNDASMSLVNKTDETKDWQTYTDKTNNLTFKYPTDWTNKDFGSMGVLFYKKSDEDTYKNSKWETLALLPGGIGYHVETGTLANSVAKFITENSSCTAEDKKVADKDGKFVKCPPLG